MTKRHRQQREPHFCLVKGCGTIIPHWKRLCDDHFRKLSFDRRRAIAQAGQDRAPHIVSKLCIEAAAWLEDHGPAAETARRMGERVDG